MLKIAPKILFIRERAMGDVLMITPLIRRCYQERGGDCEIYVKTIYVDIFTDSPYVVKAFKLEENVDIKFDIIYNLDMVYEKNNDRHVLDAYEDYVFGSRTNNRYTELYGLDSEIGSVNHLLDGVGDYIVVHMRRVGFNDPDQIPKNIDENIWRTIISEILNRTSVNIIQIGEASDLCFGGSERLFDFRTKLNIKQIRALSNESKCYIGSDSGPAHISATSSVQMIVLYTIAKIEYFMPERRHGKTISIPSSVECQGCLINVEAGGKLNCKNNSLCRSGFSASEIIEEVIKIIS